MGAVFGIYAGLFFWSEHIFGRKLNSEWGKILFFVLFIGVNLTFWPMHYLGLLGMPRRIPDYPNIFETLNYISSLGAFISASSNIAFIRSLF